MSKTTQIDSSGLRKVDAAARRLRLDFEDGSGAEVHAGRVTWTGYKVGTMPFDVCVTIDLTDDREAVCTGLELHQKPGGPAVSARSVQSAQVGRLIRSAINSLTTAASITDGGRWLTDPIASFELRKVPHRLAYVVTHRRGERPRTLTESNHRRTAAAYKRAKKSGRSTTTAVRDAFPGLGDAAARRRVWAARQAGFLPPSGRETKP